MAHATPLRRTASLLLLGAVLAASPAHAGSPGAQSHSSGTRTGTQTQTTGNPNCPRPPGVTSKNWSCKTGKNVPANLPAAPGSGPRPATPGPLPPPYRDLSPGLRPMLDACRPNLDAGDWRAFEECVLIAAEAKPSRLPALQSGGLTAWGRSSPAYNCYAFAADRHAPGPWVGPRLGGARGGDVPIRGSRDLIEFFTARGWTEIPVTSSPPPPGTEYVVLYARPGGYYEHAAVVTPTGVFAKMGELGTFRFDDVDQMSGPAFGEPYTMFSKRSP